ncbi:hypothetical protein [Amycolatopsis sp. cmx-4-61]|uniref:hypothetical protein n=1 Tax=Amycolatopsis sp. cmx-4-61 TaxID=2790937 RepID=UPI00397B4B84
MGTLFVGHGGLHMPSSEAYGRAMGAVAVPPGIKLQFFSEITQINYDNAYEDWAVDWMYRWGEIKANPPFKPLDHRHATYNFTLTSLFDGDSTAAQKMLRLAKKLMPNDDVYLADVYGDIQVCNGSPSTCPTDPRQHRLHNCSGILGQFRGDLYWLACPGIVGLEHKTNPTYNDDDDAREPADAEDREWLANWREIREALRGGTLFDWNYFGDNPDNIVHFAERYLAYEGENAFRQVLYPQLNVPQKNLLFANYAMADRMVKLGLGRDRPAEVESALSPKILIQYYSDILTDSPNQIELVKAGIRGLELDVALEVCADPDLCRLLDGWDPMRQPYPNPQIEDRYRSIQIGNLINKYRAFLETGQHEEVHRQLAELDRSDPDAASRVRADATLSEMLATAPMDED